MSIARTLQDAIRSSKVSQYEIAKVAGVSQSQISRFVNKDADIQLSTVEKLAEFFELELKPARIRKAK